MSSAAYVLDVSDMLLTDGQSAQLWLHDLASSADELRTQALAASGDCFETLAVRLEQIAAAVPLNTAEQHQLQDAVSQLLYLQRNYTIAKKP